MLRRYLMRRSKASHAFGYKRRLLIRAYFPVHACMHVGIYELVCLCTSRPVPNGMAFHLCNCDSAAHRRTRPVLTVCWLGCGFVRL